MPPDDWDKVIAVSLTGMFDVTRLAIPHLKRSQAGVIVNLSSIAGRHGFANRSPYSASKWGVIGFTKTLAIELGESGHSRQCDRAGRRRRRPHRARVRRASADQRQEFRRGAGGSDGGAVDQGDDRPERHRAACGFSRLAGGEVDLGVK